MRKLLWVMVIIFIAAVVAMHLLAMADWYNSCVKAHEPVYCILKE